MDEEREFNFMILCCFRYCLGRRSYAPVFFKEILKKNLSRLSENSLNIIANEIDSSRDLGMQIDVQTWDQVLKLVKYGR